MKKFNTKVQMMDAGMVMFRSKLNFGQAIGQVKAEMSEYGKVYTAVELSDITLPESTGDFDLFLCWSSIWRIRYISCHIENAGENTGGEEPVCRYAATFKEGNRSSVLRGVTMLAGIAILTFCIFATRSLTLAVADVLCICYIGYRWITPSRLARTVVQDLMARVKEIR